MFHADFRTKDNQQAQSQAEKQNPQVVEAEGREQYGRSGYRATSTQRFWARERGEKQEDLFLIWKRGGEETERQPVAGHKVPGVREIGKCGGGGGADK